MKEEQRLKAALGRETLGERHGNVDTYSKLSVSWCDRHLGTTGQVSHKPLPMASFTKKLLLKSFA